MRLKRLAVITAGTVVTGFAGLIAVAFANSRYLNGTAAIYGISKLDDDYALVQLHGTTFVVPAGLTDTVERLQCETGYMPYHVDTWKRHAGYPVGKLGLSGTLSHPRADADLNPAFNGTSSN